MQKRDFVVGIVTGAVVAGLAGAAEVYSIRHASVAQAPVHAQAPAPVPAVDPLAPPPDTKHPPRDPNEPSRISFAQQGEDLIVFNLLHHDFKIDSPSYLDIGAGDPILSNNTYLLYTTGGHGVLVEPNPTLVEKIRKTRPNDAVMAVGVGVSDAKEADYYVIRDRWPLNTFSTDAVAEYRRRSNVDPVEKVLKMPLVSVNHIIEQHFPSGAPDYLSIDVEGLDFDILRTLDFTKHRPAVICAETKGPFVAHEDTEIAKFLKRRGYIIAAGSLYNTIFADSKRFPTQG
jgi:FkbM family methyltransferase